MRKIEQKKSQTSKSVLMWRVGIVVAVVLTLATIWKIPQYLDGLRFADMDKKKSTIVDELSINLGHSIYSRRDVKECFNTGEGPYDNGYLWCQTSTIFVLKNDVSKNEIGTGFLRAGASVGQALGSEDGDISYYLIKLSDETTCHMSGKFESGEEFNGARRNPIDDGMQPPVIAVSCGNKAKAKHYPYID